MDLILSAKPHGLIPFAASPSFQLHSLFRREFLGCGIQLRTSGLRYRAVRGKLGFQTLSPRCVTFQDCVLQSSVIVIAATVAAFAVIELIHLNRNGGGSSDKDIGSQEISDALVCGEMSEDTIIPLQECIGKPALSSESLSKLPSICDRMNFSSRALKVISSTKDHSFVCDDGELLNPQITGLSLDVLNKELHPVDEKFTLFPMSSMLVQTKVGGSVGPLIIGQVESREKGSVVLDESDIMPEKLEKGLSDSGVHSLKAFHISNFFVVPVKSMQREFNQNYYDRTKRHIVNGSKLLDSNLNADHISTEEAYDCGKEQSEVRSLSCFNNLYEKPLNLILQNGSDYYDLKLSVKRAEVLEKGSSKPAANSDLPERQALFMCFKKTFNSNEKGLTDGCRSIQDIDRSFMCKKDNKPLSRFFQPNGGLVKDSSSLESYLRTYECLLRDARLKDCLDLLESLERKGLLDMDKVHHTRFLYACKTQKKVKEAFRFCKLINKPTLSTFNMLLSVCANSQDFDGAFEVMLLIKEAKLKPDCKLYTTLISSCGKCGKVDAMFEVFHEMVNAGVEPNVNTYGALIDGCARAGQVAKAFGAYGIMRSKNVQPDRVVFNALITACGRSGALDRAFDVLAEMRAEPKPIDPDHVTIGALVKTCIQAGQAKRAREVYKMLRLYNIKGTPDVYTIAVNSCSQNGDLEFALSIYEDMKKNGVLPDEMFLSTIIDAAGHAQNIDAAFAILKDAKNRGILVGSMTYSSLMGACCNAKNWKKALELYEDIKAIRLLPTVSTLNALVTALCDGDQLPKSVEVLDEMKEAGVLPNVVTYSILIVACEKKNEAELGFALLSKAKTDGILPNLIMCRCLTGLCLRSYEKACSLHEPIISFYSGKPEIDSIWTSRAIMVYRETISSGEIPTVEVFSQVLGCLQFPRDSLIRNNFIENLGINFDRSRCSNISSYLHGFGEYDTRSFSVLEEAASLRVVPRVSYKESPIVLDARKLLVHTVEVYILTILKGLKHRLAAGARLPCVTILLSRRKTVIESPKGEKTVYIAGRVGQAVGSLLRRLGLPYQGDESYGKIRINGLTLRRWFKPKLASNYISGRPGDMMLTSARLGKGIAEQQRQIRSNDLSLE
ncbi:pentatricopeptide repeat-containing protein MRL1, chloroplastic [Dendrobium catenatum]|uniref:Pentatricopeptide repeat-containing protein n=1 Tax=Dendrobium catenatum TaxID=906689 RepID=A0A2I0WYQ6_9ASPA|nr:pentatricopeptide repeat-containing protein MRL1, chloroplastic [Dendrobium catenatum]PKU80788.1 Pentatricopeptide repeat-containing protein [Dendrobium catenatum]